MAQRPTMRWMAAAFLALLLSGCVEYAQLSGDAVSPGALASPPRWEAGDWWKLRLTNDHVGGPIEVTQVVAVARDDAYVVGFPRDEFNLFVIAEHGPAYGELDPRTLGYDAHETRFDPLDFPLTAGKSWSTTFAGEPVVGRVVQADAATARVEFHAGAGLVLRLTYDAAARNVVRWESPEFRAEVFDYGSGFEGPVRYATSIEHYFLRESASLTEATRAMHEPATYLIPAHYTDLAFLLHVGGPAPGVYSQTLVAPDGTTFRQVVTPTTQEEYRVSYHHFTRPAGEWRAVPAAPGGVATVAGLAYVADEVPRPVDERCRCEAAPPPAAVASRSRVEWEPSAEIAIGIAAALGLGIVGLAQVRWERLVAWALPLPFYSKIRTDQVLDHPVRRRIYELLQVEPGLTTQEIRRVLEAGWGSTVHHLAVMERAGVLSALQWGPNRDWYVTGRMGEAERLSHSAMRRPKLRRVYEEVLRRPGQHQSELARTLGLHHATVVFHLRRLERAGLVTPQPAGNTVRYFPRASN